MGTIDIPMKKKEEVKDRRHVSLYI